MVHIFLLRPDFNYCNGFALSWVDKVTTGKKSFVSVIANAVALVSLGNTYLSDQIKIRLILQLIKDNSRVFQKLLKYFNGTTISTSVLPLAAVLPFIFGLILNQALLSAAEKLVIAPASVKACHLYNIAINLLMFLNNYCHILLN